MGLDSRRCKVKDMKEWICLFFFGGGEMCVFF